MTTHLARYLPVLVTAAVAAWVRLRDLDAAMVLSDSVGPMLRATASPISQHAHAPPYGWALHPPFALCLALASSLRQAVAGMLLLHSLVAPLAALGAARIGGTLAAWTVGLAVALDPGLVDTALSGSKGYLASLWVSGALLAALAARDGASWGRWAAPIGWALAVHNHPLALCAAPLLLILPWKNAQARRALLGGVGIGLLSLLPNLPQWLSAAPSAGLDPTALQAWSALWSHGPPAAIAAGIGLLAGLRRDASARPLVLATCLSLVLMTLAGTFLGYLRDYHLRVLLVPALVGLAALPGRLVLLPLLLLRVPATWTPPADRPPRPGTVAMTTQIANTVTRLPRPWVVDGAWISSVPAAEPGAVMLDLLLRTHDPTSIGPGGSTVVIVSHERGDAPPWPHILAQGDRHFLVDANLEHLAASLCGRARLGGAWDALSVLHPDIRLEEVSTWARGCPDP